MRLDETADFISEDLPRWPRDANYDFLVQVHNMVKTGGTWAYPDRGLVFTKTEEGFELREVLQPLPTC